LEGFLFGILVFFVIGILGSLVFAFVGWLLNWIIHHNCYFLYFLYSLESLESLYFLCIFIFIIKILVGFDLLLISFT
jgi:hypothetical protein